MIGRMLYSYVRRIGTRTTFVLALAAFLVAGFSFAESGSAAPLAWDYATVLTVGSRIGIGTETPDASTVIDARRSDTTDTMIKSRHLTKGAYFQTQSGVNWAGYNMLNAAGATATYFGYRGSTQFRIYDALAAQDRMLMDAAGTANGNIYFNPTNTGGVGIGTTSLASARLYVQAAAGDAVRGQAAATTGRAVWGVSTAGSGANAMGVRGDSSSTEGSGVYGVSWASTGAAYGVWGQSTSTSGRGVYGLASATTGYNIGVYAQSYSTDGYGVYGQATATTGANTGVYGRSDSVAGRGVIGAAWASTGDTYGVFGQSNSPTGRGVYGYVPATTGYNYGVYGQSSSASGYGVYGRASSTTGSPLGVYGQSDSTAGIGVEGYVIATSGTTYGVYGQSDSINGRGVAGYASANTGYNDGVYGRSSSSDGTGVFGYASSTTGLNYGVIGSTNSGGGYGMYSYGDMAVEGDFQVVLGIKAAVVETQDYGWRHLYSVESPQNWFEDFGQATLTAGEAVVAIEPIFAETVNLTGDYHVFLTPLESACLLYVTEKTSTSFTVRAEEGASCEISFDYRIIAPRLDYEELRLEEARDPEAVAASLREARPELPSP